MSYSNPTANDPMGTLNDYFGAGGQAERSWEAMKDQIRNLAQASQAMAQLHEELKIENRTMQKDMNDLKKWKQEAEEYTNVLESKVKALSTENEVMKDQINARKDQIHQAQSELGAGPDYLLCGALF
eukprot:CAMPEP_0119014628 /NCGR_PEP_ID=MMETSP1176-20130426/10072_1 /TAXON_ID=265551 /ORGANISM="Synedropsis recta cf, Strain CCMP1620" /LENGTH=126 /DNA_ID=CAMNT_0006967833 /DNA_START=49 /DNA_END=429 /DNA_ORIENTATION=+